MSRQEITDYPASLPLHLVPVPYCPSPPLPKLVNPAARPPRWPCSPPQSERGRGRKAGAGEEALAGRPDCISMRKGAAVMDSAMMDRAPPATAHSQWECSPSLSRIAPCCRTPPENDDGRQGRGPVRGRAAEVRWLRQDHHGEVSRAERRPDSAKTLAEIPRKA